MAVEEKKGVQVFLIMLRDVDLQKAYDVGNEVVVRNGGIFHGLNVFSLTGNPPQRQTEHVIPHRFRQNRVGRRRNGEGARPLT